MDGWMDQSVQDWETCSTNHDNGVEDKAIHGRQSSKAWSEIWAEINWVNSAQWYGIAEMKLEQPQSSQVSGDESQAKWLSLRQPDFGNLLATVRIAHKRDFRMEFEILHAG